MINNNQIAFIICTNNLQYYNECVRYIQDLAVPEEYDIDIISIQDASSMTEAYNEAIASSNAKYKVYLHQDTFILNREFMNDILAIFAKDEKIGMIGVIGTRELSIDANCYLGWNVGSVYACDGFCTFEAKLLQNNQMMYIPVKAIDGLVMVTQYDVSWRQDLLDGWDFYDVSQSLEMQKNGFKVVVPYQKDTWCYHDCGVSNLKNYNLYRRRMIKEYPEVFSGKIVEMELEKERVRQVERIRDIMICLLEKRAYKELNETIEKIRGLDIKDNQIREIINIMDIYSAEEHNGVIHSEWTNLKKWEDIQSYYNWCRWVLLRIEYGREDERIVELEDSIESGKISREAVYKLIKVTIPDRNGE